MTRLSALVLACALVSCTGGVAARTAQESRKPTASAAAATARLPAVQMQVGTSFLKGKLVRSCTPDGCSDGKGAVGTATLTDERVIMFTVSRRPTAASVTIKRGTKTLVDDALPPAYTMAQAIDLPNGRYDVVLDAEWKGIRARWSFRLKVARL